MKIRVVSTNEFEFSHRRCISVGLLYSQALGRVYIDTRLAVRGVGNVDGGTLKARKCVEGCNIKAFTRSLELNTTILAHCTE